MSHLFFRLTLAHLAYKPCIKSEVSQQTEARYQFGIYWVNQAGISVKDYALNRGGLTDAGCRCTDSIRSNASREKSADVIGR